MIIERRFSTKDPIRLYGAVEEVVDAVKLDDRLNPYSRLFLFLDCILADPFDDNIESIYDERNLSLIRIMTTPRRLREDFNLGEIEVGDWLEFELNRQGNLPVASQLLATDNYSSSLQWSARPLNKISRNSINESSDVDLERRLAKLDSLSLAENSVHVEKSELPTLIENWIDQNNVEIIVKDVGQANLTEIWSNGKPIFMFDVGEPTNFNKKSANPNIVLQWPLKPFLILSHWDWDHFNLGRREKLGMSFTWFAPKQSVKPNLMNFQKKLGNKLVFIHGDMAPRSGFSLMRGLSTDVDDRNGSGYQLRFQHGDAAVLLTGDADYQFIAPQMTAGITAVSVPHHGGQGSAPPNANGAAKAAVSYGLPNIHRHPNEEQMRAHRSAGWVDSSTAEPKRSDIKLYP